ncbi:MAG: hypothetical protein M3314_13975 [Actinomycetota bacterium]|nr:hypothetical protein [Actinomycetota bacterium]
MLLENTTTWDQWFYVFAPLQIYLIVVAVLVCYGDHGDEKNFVKQFFKRISTCLERWTGFPGWAAAGALSGLTMLGTAAIGLYWDVAFHVDYGRDEALFTPSHTMIVIGLGGLVYSALIAIIFATLDKAEVGFRFGGLQVPWSAALLASFGIGGVAAFPLDAMWHEAYGIDVTLWSPTHLQLVAGGSLATIVLWLMLREGRSPRSGTRPGHPTLLGRGILATVMGAVLVGTSTFQGEFDFGVPQFQVVYLPILIAAAAGFSLVLSRLALGQWGALKAVFAFLIIRGAIAILVGGPFNSTIPVFPLYLVAAAAVEGTAWFLGTENRLRFGLVAGALAGTVGVLADLVYLGLLHDVDPSPSGLPKALLLALIAGVAAAVLGVAMGRPVSGGTRVPAAAAVAAGLALVAVFAYPLPRNVGDVEAIVRLEPVGDRATVNVELIPADAADSATAFGVMSWQGGGTVGASLEKVGPGQYVSDKPLPVTGPWKTMVGLQRGDEVMAFPVYLPADPEINAPEIPAVPERRGPFVRNTTLLLREMHRGDPGAATAAYTGVAIVSLIWIVLFAVCAVKFSDQDEDAPVTRSGGPYPDGHVPDDERQSLQQRSIVGASWGWGQPGSR